MKRFLSVFILLMLSFFGKSQTYSITVGQEFNDPKKRNSLEVIYTDTNYFYVLRGEGSARSFCKFDAATSTLQYSKELIFKKKEKFFQAFYKQGKIAIFSTVESSREKTLYLLRLIHAETGALIDSSRIFKTLVGSSEIPELPSFQFSPDGNYMAIDVFNIVEGYTTNGFNKLWERPIISKVENKYAAGQCSNILITNEGLIGYIVCYRTSDTTGSLRSICLIEGINGKCNFVKIPSENKTLIDINLELVGADLICSGEFMDGINVNKEWNGKLKNNGFFTLFLDPRSGKIKSQNYDLLSPELQLKLTYKDNNTAYSKDRLPEDNKFFKHFKSFYFNGCLYVMKYHAYNFVERFYNNGRPSGNLNHHLCKEILVTKYTEDRRLDWMQIIPRNTDAITATNFYFVFSAETKLHPVNALEVFLSDNINILFYDTPENLFRFPEIKEYNPSQYAPAVYMDLVVQVVLDNYGNLRRVSVPEVGAGSLRKTTPSLRQGGYKIIPQQLDGKKRRIDLLKFTS